MTKQEKLNIIPDDLEYISETYSVIILESIMRNNGKIEEDKIISFFNKMLLSSNEETITNIPKNQIPDYSKKIIEQNLILLKNIGIVKDDSINKDYINIYENYYKSDKSYKEYFSEAIQEQFIEYIYLNKLLLLTNIENLKIKNLILDIDNFEKNKRINFLNELNIQKYLNGEIELLDSPLKNLLENYKNQGFNVQQIKKELKNNILEYKSLKRESIISPKKLNILSWSLPHDQNRLLLNIELFDFDRIEKGQSLLYDINNKYNIKTSIFSERESINNIKDLILKKYHGSNEDIEFLQEVLTDDNIRKYTNISFNGNFLDFINYLNDTDDNEINYSEIHNFIAAVSYFDYFIKEMEKDETMKIVAVSDKNDWDGRTSDTIFKFIKQRLIETGRSDLAERFIILPSVEPKGDERGLNISTVKKLWDTGDLKEKDKVLFITADCAINNIESIRKIKSFARSKNFEVKKIIVTDHHELLNEDILIEPDVITVDPAEKINDYLFQGYNPSGSYLLSKMFEYWLENYENGVENKKGLISQLIKMGIFANRADLVPSKERTLKSSDADLIINKVNSMFSSNELFSLVADINDIENGHKPINDQLLERNKKIIFEKYGEEAFEKTKYLLNKINNIYDTYIKLYYNNEILEPIDIISDLYTNSTKPLLTPYGEPNVFKLIEIKLTEISLDYSNPTLKFLFNEANKAIDEIKTLEKNITKIMSRRLSNVGDNKTIEIEDLTISNQKRDYIEDFKDVDLTISQKNTLKKLNTIFDNAKIFEYQNIDFVFFSKKITNESLTEIDIKNIQDLFSTEEYDTLMKLMLDISQLNESFNTKSILKVLKNSDIVGKNFGNKDVYGIGIFDPDNGIVRGSVRCNKHSLTEVFYHLLKEDKIRLLGHAHAAGFDGLKLTKRNSAEEMQNIVKRISQYVVPHLKRKKGKEQGFLVDIKNLKRFSKLNNIVGSIDKPTNYKVPIFIDAKDIVFKTPEDLMNDKTNSSSYDLGVGMTTDYKKYTGYYIAPVSFKPEINILITAGDISSLTENSFLELSPMGNGAYMVSKVGTEKELDIKNKIVLKQKELEIEKNDFEDKIIDRESEYSVTYDFKEILENSIYYRNNKNGVERHVSILKEFLKRHNNNMAAVDIEANGVERLSSVFNVGFTILELDENDEIKSKLFSLFINNPNILASIQDLTHTPQSFLNKKGVEPIVAKKSIHEELSKYKDMLIMGHNLLNYDNRVLESLVVLDDYSKNLLDTLDVVRDNDFAMDTDKKIFEISNNEKPIPGKYILSNPNFKNFDDFLLSKSGKLVSKEGNEIIEWKDGELFLKNRENNTIEKLNPESDFQISYSSMSTRSSIERICKLQIIEDIRKDILEPEYIKENVFQDIISDIEGLEDNSDLIKIIKIAIDKYKLNMSNDLNKEIIMLDSDIENILNSEDLDKKINKYSILKIIETIEIKYLEALKEDENKIILYKYTNSDELLHAIEIYNHNLPDEDNIEKIMSDTNIPKDIIEYLVKVEFNKLNELIESFEETHNNTFSPYSDHFQEFFILIVKQIMEKYPDDYPVEKIVDKIDSYVDVTKRKNYFYRELSEDLKPIAFNKINFKQTLQMYFKEKDYSYDYLDSSDKLMKERVNRILQQIEEGVISINYTQGGKDNLFTVDLNQTNFDLLKLGRMIKGEEKIDNDFLNSFYKLFKELEFIVKDIVNLEIKNNYFSLEVYQKNIDKIIDLNKNGRKKLLDFPLEIESISEIETILPKIENTLENFKNLQELEEKLNSTTIEEEKDIISAKIIELKSLLNDGKVGKTSSKIEKLEKIIILLKTNKLYLSKNKDFDFMELNLNEKLERLGLKIEDIQEFNFDVRDVLKDLIQRDNFKAGVFKRLEEKDQLFILNNYIKFLNENYGENIEFISNVSEFVDINSNNISNSLLEGINKFLTEPEKIRSGAPRSTKKSIETIISDLSEISMSFSYDFNDIEKKEQLIMSKEQSIVIEQER